MTAAFRNLLVLGGEDSFAGIVAGYWHGGGWLLLPLGLVTFMIWQRYLVLAARLRAADAGPPDLVDTVRHGLRAGRPAAEIEAAIAGAPGLLPNLLRQLLPRLRQGLDFRTAFGQCRSAEMAFFSHAFYVLAALVAAAPLLGLLGTVMGMIRTFDAVGGGSGATAMLVADGISQALITTQVGLAAALPGTLGLAHLYRLYRKLDSDIELCESQLCTALGQRRAPL